MTITEVQDKETVKTIRQAIKDNDGYCPCKIDKIPENKCICKEFFEQEAGDCHCGLYTKVKE